MSNNRTLHFALILTALMLFSVFTVSATTYYVKTGGNDAAAGTSDATAWAHAPGMYGATGIAASTTLQPGDSVLLHRGDTWTFDGIANGTCFAIPASGTSGNRIIFGAYGTGDRPKLNGNGLGAWYGMVSLTSISYVTIESWDMYGNQQQLLQVWGPDSVGVTIQDCLIHDNTAAGYEGIEVEGMGVLGSVTQITINDCEFYDIQHDMLKLNDGVTYATISNNTFHNGGHDAIDTLSVQTPSTYCSNFTIYGNDVTTMTDEYGSTGPGAGFSLPGLRDSEIYGNTFHDYTGSAIGTNAEIFASQGLVIRNNVIWNLPTSSSYGFWFSGGNSNIEVYNNTLYDVYHPDINDGGETFANNLAYGSTSPNGAIKNISSDPLFVDPTATPPDFHLQAGSPAIDAGTDVGLPYSGAAPDLGAYEYTPPVAPVAPSELRVIPSP